MIKFRNIPIKYDSSNDFKIKIVIKEYFELLNIPHNKVKFKTLTHKSYIKKHFKDKRFYNHYYRVDKVIFNSIVSSILSFYYSEYNKGYIGVNRSY